MGMRAGQSSRTWFKEIQHLHVGNTILFTKMREGVYKVYIPEHEPASGCASVENTAYCSANIFQRHNMKKLLLYLL